MSEVEKKLQEEMRQAREDLVCFEELVQTRGWKRLVAIADAQLHRRIHDLAFGDAPLEQMMQERYECRGIKLFVSLPQLCIDSAKQILTQVSQGDEEDVD